MQNTIKNIDLAELIRTSRELSQTKERDELANEVGLTWKLVLEDISDNNRIAYRIFEEAYNKETKVKLPLYQSRTSGMVRYITEGDKILVGDIPTPLYRLTEAMPINTKEYARALGFNRAKQTAYNRAITIAANMADACWMELEERISHKQ